MASNRSHTILDDLAEQMRYQRDQRETAETVLNRLIDAIGQKQYQTWCDVVLKDGDDWPAIQAKAETALIDLEQRDYRQTMNDTRTWARGG